MKTLIYKEKAYWNDPPANFLKSMNEDSFKDFEH